jgi:hypothetical protein
MAPLRKDEGLGVVAAGELGRLRFALVAGFLQDRRYFGIRDEALPALVVPIENHPDAIRFGGIAKYGASLGAVLLSLLGAFGGEYFQEG